MIQEDKNLKPCDNQAVALAMANLPQVGDKKLVSIGTGVGRTQKETAVVVGLSATDSSNRVVYKFALGFNLNLGNTKKDG